MNGYMVQLNDQRQLTMDEFVSLIVKLAALRFGIPSDLMREIADEFDAH